MSLRAACRLATIGFTRVHDYAPSKVDWLAHALPVEGTHAARPTAASLARSDAVTCSLTDKAGDMLDRLAASHYGFALVLSPGGVLLGRIPAIRARGGNRRRSDRAARRARAVDHSPAPVHRRAAPAARALERPDADRDHARRGAAQRRSP